MTRRHSTHTKPWVLITAASPALTLGEGTKVRYAELVEAASALANSTATCKTIVYDDSHTVRELNQREEALLNFVCIKLGKELVAKDGE